MRVLPVAMLLLICGMLGLQSVQAADNNQPPAMPGVKFTKVQDLNPNKAGPNRPIKQKWAVVVGLSKFKERRLVSNDPVEDTTAKKFYDYLIDSHGGRFDAKHVRLLTNTRTTRQGILDSLGSQWLGALTKPDDLVVVFVSTNSFPTTDGGSYLCAYDCALDNIYGTCISISDFMDTIRKNVKAERILLVIEAGYSGTAQLSEGARPMRRGSVDANKVATGSGFIILSSSKPDQMSWSNIFSTNLLAALKQKDGQISIGEAFDIAKAKTEDETEHNPATSKQTPLLQADWKGGELIVGAPAVEQASDIPINVSDYLAAESYYFRANELITQGKLDDAIVQYKKAIETDPSYADALADCGAALALKKDFSEAVDVYARAIQERPNDALYRANFANILGKMGRIPECKQQLEKAYQINPKDKVVLTALASMQLKDKNSAGAVRYLSEAIKLYPESSELFDRLSFAHATSGNVAEALENAEKAVSLDPKSLSARLNLGSTFMLSGNLNQATKAYIEATKIAPQDANAHYLLSKTLEKTGDLAGAKDELQTFVKLADPNDPRRKQAEQSLSSTQ